jgi:hypothetical protein
MSLLLAWHYDKSELSLELGSRPHVLCVRLGKEKIFDCASGLVLSKRMKE